MDDGKRSEWATVGSIYGGSKVVNINEERSTRPNGMTRIRREIELESGMILTEDKFIDDRKVQGEYKELEFVDIPSPELRIKRSTAAKTSKGKRTPKIPSLDSEQEVDAKDEGIRRKSERPRIKEEQRQKEEERRRAIVDKWEPKRVWVHTPDSKIPREEHSDDNVEVIVKAVWSYGANEVDEDFESWKPQQVIIHPPGKDPPPSSCTNETPRGLWAYAPNVQLDENDEEWCPSGMPSNEAALLVFPPGVKPATIGGEELGIEGEWTYPVDEEASFPPIPSLKNDFEPTEVTVYPNTKVPSTGNVDKLQGRWMRRDGNSTRPAGDHTWRTRQVFVYPKGRETPLSPQEGTRSQGAWGSAPGAKPCSDGSWRPADLWFFGPGEDTPDDEEWSYQGTWTNVPGDMRDSWPPIVEPQDVWEPKAVWVVPPNFNAENDSEDWQPTGVWNFSNDSGDDAEEWAPFQVMIYPNGQEPHTSSEETKIKGLWGLTEGATWEDEENWKPSDIVFVGPGEEPPEDWRPQGVWTLAATEGGGDEAEDWPQKISLPKAVMPQNQSLQPPKDPTPSRAWVFPKKKAPKEVEKGVHKGVWSYTFGKKVMDAGKKPILVDLYEAGNVPQKLQPRNGVWGYAPDAQPTSSGDFLPCDMWIFAPGEMPPNNDEWQPRGTWSEPAPPPSKREVEKKANSASGQGRVKPKNIELKRLFDKSVWVYPSKSQTPQNGEKHNPQGHWTNPVVDNNGNLPQEILVYSKGEEPSDTSRLPHGTFGYAPGSKPDDNGVWSPQDMLFFPPGQEPPPNLQNQGTWTYPHGSRMETSVAYRYEGDQVINVRKKTIYFMETSITFVEETKEHR